tara:strand:- start:7458 stop:7871 length:414 start_codon:yes stop_codon:yes gene_type:complete
MSSFIKFTKIDNIGLILFLSLYVISGYGKITDFRNTSDILKEKFENKFPVSLPQIFYDFTLVLVIILLIFGSLTLFLLYNKNSKNSKKLLKLLCIEFILFTLLATYLYHTPAVGHDFYAVLKNTSIIGGFLIIYGSK